MRLLVMLSLLFISTSSYAYLDPGTGSYILQIVVGAFAGALFVIKTYWTNIKTILSRKKNEKNSDDAN